MKNDEFVTYMGSAVCDLLLEVEQGEGLEQRNRQVETFLQTAAEQGTVRKIESLRRVRLQAVREDGKAVGIHVDTGGSAGAGLKYLVGENPKIDTEIALSYLIADELDKKLHDTVDITVSGEVQTFTICGIYQDVTSGGKTAKTVCTFSNEPSEKYSYTITLSASAPDSFAADLRQRLGGGYSVENMEEFLGQTLGGVTSQVQQASFAVLFIGIGLTVLITALFLKLHLAREAPALAVKKAMGIPFTAIRAQELAPILIAGGLGSACGVLLAELFGDKLVSGLFGMLGMGLKKIVFVDAAAWQFAVIPMILLATLCIVTVSLCAQIRHMDTAVYLSE